MSCSIVFAQKLLFTFNSRSTSGAVILSATYGIDVKSTDDPFLNANLEATHAITTAMIPGKFLVDTIPICVCLYSQMAFYKQLTTLWVVRYIPDWFPGTGFKAIAKAARDNYKISTNGPMKYAKDIMKVSLRSRPRTYFIPTQA